MRNTTGFKVFRGVTLTLLGLFTLIPLYAMVSSSLKPLADVQGTFTWWPTNLTIQPFIDMWSTVPLARYFVNSLIICTCATVASVILAIIAAFAVSRFRFRGRGVFTTTVLSTQMFPGILFLLPLFIIFVNINSATGIQLVGSYFGLILTYLTFSLPFSVWMLVGYFDSIPKELDEAAKVDGASWFRIYRSVIMPLSGPAIASVAILTFLPAWNQYLWPLMVVQSEDRRPVMVGVSYFFQLNVEWGPMMAYSTLITLPVLALFLAFQRLFIGSIASSGVKG